MRFSYFQVDNKEPRSTGVFTVVLTRQKHRGITRYSVFGSVTVKNTTFRLSLRCTAQPTVITAVAGPFSAYRSTTKPRFRPVTVPSHCKLHKLLERDLELIESTPYGTPRKCRSPHARVYACISYLALRQGLGTNILCQTPETVLHDTEKINNIPYCTIPCYTYAE